MTIASVLSAAADAIERAERWRNERDFKHGAGGHIYVELFQAATRLYGWPAVEHLQRRLGIDQLQHWQETDPAAVVKTLREAAGVVPDQDVEVAAMRDHLNQFWAKLTNALPWLRDQQQASRADEVVEWIGRLRAERDALVAKVGEAQDTTRLGEVASQLTPEELEIALVALADIRTGYPDDELDPAAIPVIEKIQGIVQTLP